MLSNKGHLQLIAQQEKNPPEQRKYSDLPNNRAANLIIFQGKKHLHNLIKTYTFINF